MSRFSIMLCAVMALLVVAMPASAATQNVKVSGDITLRGIYQEQYDLNDTTSDTADESAFFQSSVGVNVDADLTDNVSTQIRLVNQRDFETYESSSSNLDINLDLANVTLKELFYSPLTVTIGRQDLWYGKGFIVGSALLAGSPDPESSIGANEFTELTSFDAITATLDLAPWTIDGVYAKIHEAAVATDEDIDLMGLNIGYQFEDYNAEAEGYYFVKQDKNGTGGSGQQGLEVNTIGVRGSAEFIENLATYGEVAYQFGDYPNSSNDTTRDIDAWGMDFGADYTWVDVNWTPKLGVEWIYYSGEEAADKGDYEGWDPMYRGKFDTVIREFLVSTYQTDDGDDQAGTSNQHQIAVDGTIMPTEDVSLRCRYSYIFADEAYVAGRDEEVGHEVDLIGTYNYTEDVMGQLIAAWFIPGDYYSGATSTAKYDDTATAVVGTVKVSF